MRKKLLFGACAALFLVAGITFERQLFTRENMDVELMLKNIEALAEEENIGGECNWIVIEYSPDHKDCPSRTGAMCCTF